MILDKIKKNKGFTLIELLVVIAVIGILTATIFSSFTNARIKANNSAKLQEVDQLIRALALYNNGETFPNYGDVTDPPSPQMYCIGYSSEESCLGILPTIFGFFVGNTSLNNELNAFIPGPPKNDFSVMIGEDDFRGIAYGCSNIVGGNCMEYELWWMFEGESSCPRGSVPTSYQPNHILCKFNSSNQYNL